MKMSPKQATIGLSIVLTHVLLTLTLSNAQSGCKGYNSIPDVLSHYNIPPSLFPDDVKSFTCKPVGDGGDKLLLSIQLHGPCNVTRSLLGVGNVVACQPNISAIISKKHMDNIQGVTVTLTYQGNPVGELMTVTQVTVDALFLQFNSDKGPSPFFPLALFPDQPPKCDGNNLYIRKWGF